MKKILLGFVLLLTTATMNAQIKLEHVIEGYEFLTMRNVHGYGTYEPDNRYVGLDDLLMMRGGESWELCFYDVDGNLYKRLKDIPEDDYFYEVEYIARNVFTTDGQICRLVTKNKYVGEYGSYTCLGISIIGENGNVIQEISNNVTDKPMLVKVSNKYKLLFNDYECVKWNSEAMGCDEERFYVYVYACPGNGEATTSVENVPAKVKRNAYPNPATDLVTLPYDANGATSMKIYDMQGKLVERKFLDKNKQELQLNVKNYPTGMYFFEVNGESNSFIVE
ncbi:MAG: T9SS type A sorting domain-containing protein [Paludibacteraceae bacterium]|nr:T9SS type A sorting domain-containing protein [Paludibacteraceae bacterium]